MPASAKRIVGPVLLGNSATTVYTVPSSTRVVIRHIHATADENSLMTVSIGTDAAGTRLFKDVSVPGASSFDVLAYIPLEAGETIQAYATSANHITLTIGGDELTLGESVG